MILELEFTARFIPLNFIDFREPNGEPFGAHNGCAGNENSNGSTQLNWAFAHRTAPAEWSSQEVKDHDSRKPGKALQTDPIEYFNDCIKLPPLILIRTPPIVRTA